MPTIIDAPIFSLGLDSRDLQNKVPGVTDTNAGLS